MGQGQKARLSLPKAKINRPIDPKKVLMKATVAGILVYAAWSLGIAIIASCEPRDNVMEKGEAMAKAGILIKVHDCVGDPKGWVCFNWDDTQRVSCTAGECQYPSIWYYFQK